MTKTVDRKTADKIIVELESFERIEVCDAEGRITQVMYLTGDLLARLASKGFLSLAEEPVAPLPPSVSLAELRRRAGERGGRSTAEVLADLDAAAKAS